MIHHLLSRTIRQIFGTRLHLVPASYLFTRHTSSTALQSSNRGKFRYIMYLAIILGGTITFSFVYQVYRWTVQVPISPNFHRNQDINLNNVLACTALLRNLDQPCSGDYPMKTIGAATGINFKLVQTTSENISTSTQVLLNDKDIIERHIFDNEYALDYFETLADLLCKLDENHCQSLLSNIIGYYIYLCPECHSSITRQMISCSVYLYHAGLQTIAADISDIKSLENEN